METGPPTAATRAPICGSLAAILWLVCLSVALVPSFRYVAFGAAEQPRDLSTALAVLDVIPLPMVCFAVAAILRRERLPWLSWAVLFSFGVPILLALIFAIGAAFRS